MPKFNADAVEYEPIEVVLGGVTYVIKDVSQSMFDRIKEAGQDAKEKLEAGDEDVNLIYRQLGIIIGVDPEVFADTDLRKAAATTRFLMDTITKQVEGTEKNDLGED